MTIYIIDSNLVFSAVLNQNSKIGQFIISSSKYEVKLYAPAYLKSEIEDHFSKLLELTKLPKKKVRESIQLIYQRITFIDDHVIPIKHYSKAASLVRDIDYKDVVFVALNEYLDELLWTGDMELYHGLRSKGYNKVVRFEDIKQLFDL